MLRCADLLQCKGGLLMHLSSATGSGQSSRGFAFHLSVQVMAPGQQHNQLGI